MIPCSLWLLASFCTLLFWVSCRLTPLCFIFFKAFEQLDGNLILSPLDFSLLEMTLKQALLSTGVSAGLGLLIGLALGKYLTDHEHSRLPFFFTLPLSIPTLVVGIAWIAWFGKSGLLANFGIHLDWVYHLKAIIAAHAFLNIPWIAIRLAQARKEFPKNLLATAELLGASRFQQFYFLLWPHLRWPFLETTLQVFHFCTVSFTLVLLLGGGPPVETLETEIYANIRSLDLSQAARLAVWQCLMTLIPSSLIFLIEKKTKRIPLPSQGSSTISPHSRSLLLRFILTILALFFSAPYLIIFSGSTLKTLMQIKTWLILKDPLIISLKLALFSSLMTLFFTVMLMIMLQGWKKYLKIKHVFLFFFNLNNSLSALVIGLGFWIVYESWINPLEGSLTGMVILQTTLLSPLAFRMLWPMTQHTRIDHLKTALLLGASSQKAFWRIEWPRWKKPFFSVFSMLLGASLGEIGAMSVFASMKVMPLPLCIYAWMEHYRFNEAQAATGILLIISFICIFSALETGQHYLFKRSSL